MAKRKIFIGADHGAFKLKSVLVDFLKKNFDVADLGTHSEESCDYPDFSFAVAEAVRENPENAGIVICRSGIGASICANKVDGIRAALCRTKVQAILSRQHNNANVLALGSNDVDDQTAKEIATAWLNEPYEGGRHNRRLEKIETYERERNKKSNAC